MNPLRSLFVQLSRIPPAAMLAGIVGLAVMVTAIVTDMLKKQEASFVSQQQEMQKRLDAKQTVVYAVKDIPEGQTIPSEALEERRVEAGKAPQDALGSGTLASGRVAKYGIAANQIVSQHDLASTLAAATFEARLKDGMRAVTFAVDNNSGVAGFVTPESRIDIIGMVGSGAETKAAPILSDIQVIAVGQTYQRQTTNGGAVPASSVTVEVTPEDTQKLIRAVAASKLYLALRNDKDHTPIATVDVTSLFAKPQTAHNPDVIGLLPPAPMSSGIDLPPASSLPIAAAIASPPPPPLTEIETWSAGKKDVLSFPHAR